PFRQCPDKRSCRPEFRLINVTGKMVLAALVQLAAHIHKSAEFQEVSYFCFISAATKADNLPSKCGSCRKSPGNIVSYPCRSCWQHLHTRLEDSALMNRP